MLVISCLPRSVLSSSRCPKLPSNLAQSSATRRGSSGPTAIAADGVLTSSRGSQAAASDQQPGINGKPFEPSPRLKCRRRISAQGTKPQHDTLAQRCRRPASDQPRVVLSYCCSTADSYPWIIRELFEREVLA